MTVAGTDAVRAKIVEDIRNLAAAQGGAPPGQQAFERAMGWPRSAWCGKYWSRWSDALREAGFTANERRRRLDDNAMLAKFAEVARHLGRIPSYPDLSLYRRNAGQAPGQHTYAAHFGRKQELLARLKLWVATKPELSDIAAMIPEPEQARSVRRSRKDGAVYLLRSGKRFKIGCSRALERRVKSIQALLPESDLVHSIETDDPRGVEAYWHRRFAGRRLKGEWFELSPEDVAAFRRWRTQ